MLEFQVFLHESIIYNLVVLSCIEISPKILYCFDQVYSTVKTKVFFIKVIKHKQSTA